MPTPASYAYRVPRFAMDLPLEFFPEAPPDGSPSEHAITGRTTNLSETGALVQLQRPVRIGDAGRLDLRLGTLTISLGVKVKHAEFPETGFSFVFASEAEHQFVRLLTRVAARNATRASS